MNVKEIIGLRRRPQMIAAGIYIVALVSLFLPFASVGGKTVMGFSAGGILAGEMLFNFAGTVNGTALHPDYVPDALD